MKDSSNKTLDNLTLLVKLVAGLLVVNVLVIWYGIYELRTYRQATKLLRSGTDFIENENLYRFTELDKFIQDQKKRGQVHIDNKGTVNIRDIK
jgi:hypothetical protein